VPTTYLEGYSAGFEAGYAAALAAAAQASTPAAPTAASTTDHNGPAFGDASTGGRRRLLAEATTNGLNVASAHVLEAEATERAAVTLPSTFLAGVTVGGAAVAVLAALALLVSSRRNAGAAGQYSALPL